MGRYRHRKYKRRRRRYKNTKTFYYKIVIAALIILFLIFLYSEGYLANLSSSVSPKKVIDNPQDYLGREITIRKAWISGSGNVISYTMPDGYLKKLPILLDRMNVCHRTVNLKGRVIARESGQYEYSFSGNEKYNYAFEVDEVVCN